MKKILFFSLLALTCINLFAQDWAPVGAKWFYDQQFTFSGDINYILYTSEKDTIVKGQSCRKITKRHDLDCYDRPQIELMFSKSDSVFFYEHTMDSFQLLYCFNAQKNDTWLFMFQEDISGRIDTVHVVVDSIFNTIANAQSLRSLYVTYTIGYENFQYQYSSVIVEKIGDLAYMFNFFPISAFVCDADWSEGIRCYEDPVFGNYHFPEMDPCEYTYIENGINTAEHDNLCIYPNPVVNMLRLDVANSSGKQTIQILNGIGQVQYIDNNFIGEPINIQQLSDGMYFLNFSDKDNIVVKKFVVKH
jgi:hypothetical protein